MLRILVVEDNEVNRELLQRRLARRGHAVLTAGDGGEAMALASRELPDLILMDMTLPTVSGWEATRRLKAAERTRRIPIIALTGHAQESDRARCLAAGCDEYETKPVDFPTLLAKIHALTARDAGPALPPVQAAPRPAFA